MHRRRRRRRRCKKCEGVRKRSSWAVHFRGPYMIDGILMGYRWDTDGIHESSYIKGNPTLCPWCCVRSMSCPSVMPSPSVGVHLFLCR